MTETLNLSGLWKLKLDEKSELSTPIDYNDSITLPSTTSYSKKGKPNPDSDLGNLTDEYKFSGSAWFSKSVATTGLADKCVKLYLERTRITTLFFDGKKIGSSDSLVSPHIYDLTGLCSDGEHTIDICVSNVGYKTGGGHLTSPDTQSNWLGIIGRIELLAYEKTHIENIVITSDIKTKSVAVKADVVGNPYGTVKISAESINGPLTSNNQSFEEKSFEYTNGKLQAVYTLGDEALLWSEFEPNLYKLKLTVGGDTEEAVFGLREFLAQGDKFRINGKKTFLRGKHDGLVFPKTGFVPCDLDSWLKVLETSKNWGMNHYRFHTCCPPDAAFLAADMLGVYMEPELPFWGTIAAPGEEWYNEAEQDFLIEEGKRMMASFGNHPSYCLMSLGNELWGSTSRLNDILGVYKSIDRRHLYTQGSNNFQFFPSVLSNDDFFCGVRLSKDRLIRGSFAQCDAPLGHVQTDRPSTQKDYDSIIKPEITTAEATEADENGMVKIQYGTTMKLVKASEADAGFVPEVPIVTHEIGQYETYPNFDQIEKYTGPLKPRNIEIFKKRLEDAGLGELAHNYFYASGKLAAACYKEELEAVLRSKRLGGFQLLDLQDFPGQGMAFVGMLDPFMDSKGILTDSEWRSFCSKTVALARFDSYVLEEGETFKAKLSVTTFSDKPVGGKSLCWRLTLGKKTILEGSALIPNSDDNYIDVCEIKAEIPSIDTPQDLTLSLEIDGTDIRNSYRLYAYPKVSSVELDRVYMFKSAECEEAKKLLSDGKTVLIVPPLEDNDKSIKGFYCQDFWCYPMFRTISESMNRELPVGTMGLLIDNKHPSLQGFPSEIYSTEQWWDIVENSRSDILDGDDDKNVIIRTIDNFERNHSLGLMYEYKSGSGKVIVLNCDLDAVKLTPNGRQFIKSVLDYARN